MPGSLKGADMQVWKKVLITAAIIAAGILLNTPLHAVSRSDSFTKEDPSFVPMAGPGKKVSLGHDGYLVYAFAEKPKLGTVIVKVQVFNKAGEKDTTMVVTGDAGMPSMRGVHDTGDQPFRISKRKDYLLPINLVMPGEWELRLTVTKAGKVLLKGKYLFNV